MLTLKAATFVSVYLATRKRTTSVFKSHNQVSWLIVKSKCVNVHVNNLIIHYYYFFFFFSETPEDAEVVEETNNPHGEL